MNNLMKGIEKGICELVLIGVAEQLLLDISKEMGLDKEDFSFYLDQVEMDNAGKGFNGKGVQIE